MRIHLSLEPSHFGKQAVAGPSSGPLAQLGGELVLIELQGELGWEGNKEGGVVGVVGLDRPDKPTLHLGEHHLLHGKFATLAKPLAVIRRAVAAVSEVEGVDGAVEGDADEEEEIDEETQEASGGRPSAKRRKSGAAADEEEEDEGPLFPPESKGVHTPPRRRPQDSSSPFQYQPSSSVKDYSSELDFSSPPNGMDMEDEDDEDEDEEDVEAGRSGNGKGKGKKRAREEKVVKRKSTKPERTRVYEVVGVVRKKVVFALRPEPIVTATVLPE